MSMKPCAAWAAMLTAAALLPAGCGLSNAGAQGPKPAQVLKTRLAAFVSAPSVALDGTVSMEGTTYQVTLSEDGQFRAQGTIAVNHQPVVLTWTGEQLFLKSADYFTAQQLYVGTRWVLTRSDKLQALVAKLANRRELADAFAALAGADVAQRAGGALNGVRTMQLTSDTATATVPAAGGAPLRLATAVDQALSDGLSDLKLNVSVTPVAMTVTPPPAPYVDLGNLNTLPAYFEQVSEPADSFRFESCDARGCTLAVDFRNQGGRVGASTATFYILQSSSRAASCTVSIPATDHGSTVRAGCRVNWNMNAGDSQGSVDVTNPQ
ncbi:MAG TPA: hypothetical protein VOB72_21150 [Candidatus Dormibacteraeota bacterium]|nr:hypothetical protein [Candidatus Dormibacteraeota bacterium]